MKVKKLRMVKEDGTLSEEIDIAVKSDNVEMKSGLTLQDELNKRASRYEVVTELPARTVTGDDGKKYNAIDGEDKNKYYNLETIDNLFLWLTNADNEIGDFARFNFIWSGEGEGVKFMFKYHGDSNVIMEPGKKYDMICEYMAGGWVIQYLSYD